MSPPQGERSEPFILIDVRHQSEINRLWSIAPEFLYQVNETYVTATRRLSQDSIVDFQACTGPPIRACAAMLAPDLSADTIKQIRGILEHTARRASQLINERVDSRTRGRFGREVLIASTVEITILVALGFITYCIFRWTGHRLSGESLTDLNYFTITLCSGAAGAATSVTLRLNNVERLSSESTSYSAAYYRVALGVLFALALLLLLRSGLVDVFKIPSNQASSDTIANPGYFWGAIGVLAGFNERWIGTLLTRSTDTPAPIKSSPP